MKVSDEVVQYLVQTFFVKLFFSTNTCIDFVCPGVRTMKSTTLETMVMYWFAYGYWNPETYRRYNKQRNVITKPSFKFLQLMKVLMKKKMKDYSI